MNKTKHAKCPRCHPDEPYAIFSATYGTLPDSDEYVPIWECNNCFYKMPRRFNKLTSDKPTKSQQYVINKLLEAFGGKITTQNMAGRKVWITIDNEDRKWFQGNTIYGTIGPAGSFDITLSKLGGDVKINDWIGVKVYLGDRY